LRIAIGSIFRNSEHYVGRYAEQVAALRATAPQHEFRCVLAEGDSTDKTYEALKAALPRQFISEPGSIDVPDKFRPTKEEESVRDSYFAERGVSLSDGQLAWYRLQRAKVRDEVTEREFLSLFRNFVFKREHGGPVFGSVDSPIRFRQMSWVQDGVMERITPEDDVLIYVEADLIWQPETMLKLLEHLEKPGVDLVYPMGWYQGRNYDMWAFRGLDGIPFGLYPPFHTCMFEESTNGLYPLSSSGSCIVMKSEVARNCRFDPPEMAIVGFGWNARSKGYKIWFDPNLRIEHPL